VDRKSLDVDVPFLRLENLEHEEWEKVAARCLACGNCTMVCPTCFCWDTTDQTNLSGRSTRRERTWDSCFNPNSMHVADFNFPPGFALSQLELFGVPVEKEKIQ
jgi:ferredoxin